jgi:hypothetical protein
MISLKQIGPNQNSIVITNTCGTAEIFFSYDTPVACSVLWLSGHREVTCTDKFYSVTTSKHINSWLRERNLHREHPDLFRNHDHFTEVIETFLK